MAFCVSLKAHGHTFIMLLYFHDCTFMLTLNSSPPPDKMAAISQTIFSDAFSWLKSFVFWLNFTEVFPKGPDDNNPVLVQIMAWRRIGDKPLSEPMLTRFTDPYICGTRGRWVNIKQLGKWFKMQFRFWIMFIINVAFLCEISQTQWIFSQNFGYWWSGALAPGHQ